MKVTTSELFKKLKLSVFSENIDKLSKLGEKKTGAIVNFYMKFVLWKLKVEQRKELRDY